MYGQHTVCEALANPRRRVLRLVVSENRRESLPAGAETPEPEVLPPQRIGRLLEAGAAHQGIAARVLPLEQPGEPALSRLLCEDADSTAVLLDQITDPRNVGAIIRSAWAFGVTAVLAPARGSPAESGALAKAASGGLEHVPYLMIGNLARTIAALDELGVAVIGLDDRAETDIAAAIGRESGTPMAIVLGAEGTGLRRLTRQRCRTLARIPTRPGSPSLNVSNACAASLYALRTARPGDSQ